MEHFHVCVTKYWNLTFSTTKCSQQQSALLWCCHTSVFNTMFVWCYLSYSIVRFCNCSITAVVSKLPPLIPPLKTFILKMHFNVVLIEGSFFVTCYCYVTRCCLSLQQHKVWLFVNRAHEIIYFCSFFKNPNVRSVCRCRTGGVASPLKSERKNISGYETGSLPEK